MKTIKTESILPFFSGFYHSIHDTDSKEESEIEYLKSEDYIYNTNLKENPFEKYERIEIENALCYSIDYKQYYKDYSEQYFDKFIEQAETIEAMEKLGIQEIKFQKLYLPRCYNYSTDQIHVEYIHDENNKLYSEYMENNKDDLNFDIMNCLQREIEKISNEFELFLYYEMEIYLSEYYNTEDLLKELQS